VNPNRPYNCRTNAITNWQTKPVCKKNQRHKSIGHSPGSGLCNAIDARQAALRGKGDGE